MRVQGPEAGLAVRRMADGHLHPRPQLARPEWYELDGPWGFAYDDQDRGVGAGWMRDPGPFTRVIQVPFPPESPASGIGDRTLHPIVWYRRSFRLPDGAGRWILHFGAVDHQAHVWVDGSLVCAHSGGHTPFAADVTAALSREDEHVIVVRAEDRPSLEQPRGKQSWMGQPEEIWYEGTTGIWQPVWLECVADVRITALRWTPDVLHRSLRLDASLGTEPRRPLRLRVLIHGSRGVVADDTYTMTGDTVTRQIKVDLGAPSLARRRDILWSPEYPNLLSVVATLQDADGRVLDVVHSYVGLRSVGVRDGSFRLNGRPYYLRLVLHQGYWPSSHLAPPTPDDLRREVELIKSFGFNGVRIHQKVEDPRFLYWCDRLGLVVWEEMPSCFAYGPRSLEQIVHEWMEVLRRDHSHPCIVTWVPFNESWGVEALRDDPAQRAATRAVRLLTQALDGSRPVVGNDGWEFDGGDIIGIHDYTTDPEALRQRYGTRERLEASLRHLQPNGRPIMLPDVAHGDEPVVLSEFGGITFTPKQGDEWFGYGTVPDAGALLHLWESLFEAIFSSDALTGFCYTQLADTRQETNGMVTATRVPKVDPARVRRAIRAVSRSIPMEELIRHVLDPVDVSPSPGS